eukprot:CAMPEP_0117481244 /NCGR_PEP_ID=MMETSP0784-20121206/12802_1 /TAXON_ID=39447 /ORGANISM="" /LENGTH=440 /DNA_ID=CAMNT_0005275699 /DNA_START=6 /DNA_END=1325 /DNA_ORIENTATION=+
MSGDFHGIYARGDPSFSAGRHGLSLPRILGCSAPVVYVWSLPILSGLHISGEVTFARRAPGVQSIEALISTPQATGALAATLFFPMKELWLPGLVLQHEPWARPTLVTFQILFGVILTAGGMLHSIGWWGAVLELTLLVVGIAHYRILLRNCHVERRWMCKALVLFLVVFTTSAAVVLCAYLMFPRLTDLVRNDSQPWLFFCFQSLSVTALALFPLLWHRDRALEDRHGLVPIGQSFYSIGNSSRALRVLGTVFPILYVWSLPVLASHGVFVLRCVGFPQCGGDGESVSSMISTPMATGAMASTFFWPMMHLWMPGAQPPDSRVAHALLYMFQICFGLFLSAPVSYAPQFHALVVSLFCCSAVAHLTFMLCHCLRRKFWLSVGCLVIAILMLMSLAFISFAAQLDPQFFYRGPAYAWCFYACEAAGLSAVALFPVAWRRK